MVIFIGTNDALSTIQAVSLEQYRSNMESMAKMVLDKGIKLILVGPTLHDQIVRKEVELEQLPIASSEKNYKYSKAVEEVAKKFEVPFIDLWSAHLAFGKWTKEEIINNETSTKMLFPDGIHFSPLAYEVLYNELKLCIGAKLPELDSINLKRKLMLWRDVDRENIKYLVFHPN